MERLERPIHQHTYYRTISINLSSLVERST
nr:MAG TPA: hypothetical protein [Caudoviricetes sp.]